MELIGFYSKHLQQGGIAEILLKTTKIHQTVWSTKRLETGKCYPSVKERREISS